STEGKWLEIEQALDWINSVHIDIKEINSSQSYIKNIAQKFQEKSQVITNTQMEEQMEIYRTTYTDVMKHWKTVEEELEAPGLHEPRQSDWVNFVIQKSVQLIDSLPQLKDNCHLAHVVQEAESIELENVTSPYLD